jgi:hypothetical protein
MMSGQPRKWGYGLFLLVLLAATGANADSVTASYGVSGPMGSLVWAQGDLTGTDVLIFALAAAAPVMPATPAGSTGQNDASPTGPRVVFSVTQRGLVNGAWVQYQWSGDWPLSPEAFTVAGDLTQGTLDTLALGTLQASSASGTGIQRNVPGRLQVVWTGTGDIANTTLANTYQTSSYTTALQVVGLGRTAVASASLTIPALGAPIQLQSRGSLASAATGLLAVTMP